MSGFAVGSYVGPPGVRRFSFEEGMNKLNGRDKVKLENNTFLVKVDDETLGVKLHNTIVVYVFKSGIYQLDTGGWRSSLTRDRIVRYGPVSVYQRNNIWYVGKGIFEDGVRVDSNGKVLTSQRGVKEVESNKRKLDRMVLNYIRGFCQHVVENGLETPSAGDCWSCYFAKPDEEPLGLEHLLKHIEQNYFVPSLLRNVVRKTESPEKTWQYIGDNAKRGDSQYLRRILTAYFRKRKSVMLDLMP